MNKCKYPFVTLFLLCANTILAQSNKAYFVHADGYGPIHIGMSIIDASKSLNTLLIPLNPMDDDEYYCRYVSSTNDHNRIRFMVENTIITRIDVYTHTVYTDTGITVGMKAQHVYKAYGKRVTS